MAFREFLRKSTAATLLHLEDLRVVAIHDTADPEVIIAESATCGTVVANGRLFELPSVGVLRVRDGKILSWRDYVNPLAGAQATGSLPLLFATLASQETS